MAIIVGDVVRNLNTGVGAKLIRTIVQTINSAQHYSQAMVLVDADENNIANVLGINSEGRAKASTRKVVAVTVSIAVVAVTNADTLILAANSSRLVAKVIPAGESVKLGFAVSAVSIGPYYANEEWMEEIWRGALYGRRAGTVDTTVTVVEYSE